MKIKPTPASFSPSSMIQAGFFSIKWILLVIIFFLIFGLLFILFRKQEVPLGLGSNVTIEEDESFIALSNNVKDLSRSLEKLSTYPSLSSTEPTTVDTTTTQPTYSQPGSSQTTYIQQTVGPTLTGSYTITHNLSVGGTITASNIVNDLSAGSGIEISGDDNTPTITNNDRGSSQSIFKNIVVSGQNTISASNNNDQLTFVAGSNISLSTDSNTKNLTISASAPTVDYTQSGWTTGTNSVFLTDSTANIGLGTSSPTEKLTIAGGNLLIGARADAIGSWTKISQPTAGTVASGGTPSIETIRSMTVYNGSLYVGTQEGGAAEIYRWDGDTGWTRVSFGAGQIGAGGIATVDAVTKLTVYNGKLYAATARTNQAELFVYEGGTTWTRLNATAGTFVTTASINEIESLAVFNGALYFGTTEANFAEIYRYDGSVFTKVSTAIAGTVASGGTATIDSISSLAVYDGNLYAGTNETGAGEVYVYGGGTTWTKVTQAAGTISEDVGANSAVKGVRNMAVFNGSLYIGTEDDGDAEVYRYNGGTSWTSMGTGTPGEFVPGEEQYDKVHSMVIYKGQLYIGMDDPADAVVYRLDGGRTWTRITDAVDGTIISGDTTDITEIRSLTVFNDTLIAGTAKTNAAEIYQYSATEGQSYGLKFTSNSDHVAPETGVNNEATISFLGEQQANSNRGNDSGGQFLFSHGLTTATGAYDVAEDYPTRETNLVYGEILAIDSNEAGFVKRATLADRTKIVGVYSGNPALRLSQKESEGALMVSVALVGRVPVKIDPDSPVISAGDHLAVSSAPGKASKANRYNYTVGKSLESWDCSNPESPLCKDQIMMSVQPGLWIGTLTETGEIEAEPSVTPTLSLTPFSSGPSQSVPSSSEAGLLSQRVLSLEDTVATLAAQIKLFETLPTISPEVQVDISSQSAYLSQVPVDLFEHKPDQNSINIKPLNLAKLQIFDGKLEIFTNGDLHLTSGRLIGNDTIRGVEVVDVASSSVRVSRSWEAAPITITATPQWDTYAWVSDLSQEGFTLNFKLAPAETNKVFWQALW